MKIVQVMPEFVIAGAETMCANLTFELIKLGHEVLVISLFDYHSELTKRMEEQHVKITYLGKKMGVDIGVIRRLRKCLKEFKPDIIHTHLYSLKYVAFANIGFKSKIVHTIHSVAQRVSGGTERRLNYFFFHRCHVTPVALSKAIQKTIMDFYKLDINSIPIVFNGIPIERCIPKTDYEFGNNINIIHVGRFHKVKNHIEMIKAMSELHHLFPNSRLFFVGDGEQESEIMKKVEDIGASDYIIFCGLISDVYPLLNEADIFLLPSQFEGMPMTLIEAMATAMPIVASNVGGIPDMIEDGVNGILCEPSAKSITECLLQVIENKAFRKRLGNAALGSASNYSSYKMAKDYEQLYERLIVNKN